MSSPLTLAVAFILTNLYVEIFYIYFYGSSFLDRFLLKGPSENMTVMSLSVRIKQKQEHRMW